jgi:hypothetical protein
MKQEYIGKIIIRDKVISRKQFIDEVIEDENMELGCCQQVNNKKYSKQNDPFPFQKEWYQQPKDDIDTTKQADVKKGSVQIIDGFNLARKLKIFQ